MTRLVLIWLAAVVAVNCELFPKEDAQENKVVPVDAYDAPTVQEDKVAPVDAYEAPTILNEENHMLFKAKETRGQFLAKWNRQLYQDKEDKKGRRKRESKSNNVRKQTNKEEEKGRRKRETTSINERKKVTLSDFDSNTIDMDDLCKKTLTLDAGTEFTLNLPPKKKKCKKMVVKANDGETLSMNCPRFQLNDGGCKQESLTVKGSDKYEFCDSDAPDLSGEKSLKLTYKRKNREPSDASECVITASGGTTGETGQICDECGVADINPGRIVGGQDTRENEYPWMLSMIMKKGGKEFSCGASLITPSWALTAQHCIEGIKKSGITIAYGIHKYDDSFTDPVKVDKVILHPGYDTKTLENDIALVKLKTPVPVDGKNVLPVCLASSAPEVGDPAVVTGWGALEYDTGDYPENLQEVEVDIISNEECSDKYADIKDAEITEAMICAARKNKDACSGDSGGPLVVKDSDGKWKQVGIVSSGRDCADSKYPGVYARVDHFFNWITDEISECV